MELNLETLSDEEFRKRVPAVVYLGFLILLGLPGNVSVLIAYTRFYNRTTHRVFILTLAAVDTVSCIISMPFEIVELRYQYTFYAEAACKSFRFITGVFAVVSPMVLMGLAFNRFRLVCQPLKPQMTIKMAYIGCGISFALSLLLCLPTIPFTGTRLVQLKNNITGYDCSVDDNFKNSKFRIYYYGFLTLLVVICIIVLTVIYSCIARRVYQHTRHKAKILKRTAQNLKRTDEKGHIIKPTGNQSINLELSLTSEDISQRTEETAISNQNKDVRTKDNNTSKRKSVPLETNVKKSVTKIAFLVSFVFIISYVPHLVLNIGSSIKGYYFVPPSPLASAILPILSRSYFLSSVLNPIIYCFCDARFRNVLKRAVHVNCE